MEIQARKKMSNIFVPDEIIEQMLVLLPAKNLVRCRIVCKRWNQIIQDPQFIMAHLERAPRRPLLFSSRASCSKKLYPSEAILFDESWSPSRWNLPGIEPDDVLCASCNGLVCLYSDKSAIKIANLATSECLHIAKPARNLTGDRYYLYNFGFHPVTKEYKVIHILCRKHHLHAHLHGDSFDTIQVYTLGEDKWRDVKAPKLESLYNLERSGVVVVGGAMYWLTGDKGSKWGHTLVSFDLSDEHFECIQLPNNVCIATCPPGCSRLYCVTELDGKVCVVAGQERYEVSRGLAGKLQIWTLDSKTNQSWSQKYSIQISSLNIARPHFIHGDKIVVYDYGKNMYCHELVAQNVEIEQRKKMKLLNYSPRWHRRNQLCMHVESLVRLDAYRKGGIVCKPKRQDGWELKRWVRWTQELSVLEKLWRRAYALEHFISKLAVGIGMDDVIPQLEKPPEKNCLNWVEQKRVREMLSGSIERLDGILKGMVKIVDARNEMAKVGWIPNADTSHQSMVSMSLRLIKRSIVCLLAALNPDDTT